MSNKWKATTWIDAGALSLRTQLLRARADADGNVALVPTDWLWCARLHSSKSNIFAKHGMAVDTVFLEMRAREDVVPGDHFALDGQHLFATYVAREARAHFMTVTTAQVPSVTCRVARVDTVVDPVFCRPTATIDRTVSFPASVTEKYNRLNDGGVPDVTAVTWVLVVPKLVVLEVGEVVTIDGRAGKWAVTIAHELGDYANEYEVLRQEDA